MNYLKGLAGHDDGESSSTSAIYGNDRVKDPTNPRTRGLSGKSKMDEELSLVGEHIILGLKQPGKVEKLEVAPGIFFEHFQSSEDAESRRKVFGVSDASWLASLSNPMEGGVTKASGKSGSLFWKTHDGKYFFKSLPAVEANTLIELMPSYRDYVEEAMMSKRLCLLPQVFGVYCIYAGNEKLYLMCFSNVFDTPEQPIRVYDLKGTTEDRYVEEAPGRVMKDLNYENTMIAIPAADREALVEACRADSEFLKSCDVMDYSLLLGVYEGASAKPAAKHLGALSFVGTEVDEESGEPERSPAIFRMGIIDIGCEWNLKKTMAYYLKKPTLGFCAGEEIDTEPPEYYSQRFTQFVEEKTIDK